MKNSRHRYIRVTPESFVILIPRTFDDDDIQNLLDDMDYPASLGASRWEELKKQPSSYEHVVDATEYMSDW